MLVGSNESAKNKDGNWIENPVLPGFHPDPSILRVGSDYYIATSTFEWFPGVRIFHSKDLKHWRLAATPLDRLDLLDMRGEEASCGVWAPCLSHDGERFYLVYSDVKSKIGPYWDVHNYVTTATEIDGSWSDRVYLNRSGFDPSMFHDEDGRSWLLNLIQDPRPARNRFAGIVLQEYDTGKRALLGRPKTIYTGTELGSTEGAHLYKKDGYYYLVTAEGGTAWKHAVSVARSRQIDGPYETMPGNPLLTAWEKLETPLHKAGHGSLVATESGEWYLAYLCARPLGEHRQCILGRETALHPVEWPAGEWPRLAGADLPSLRVPSPQLPEQPWPPEPDRINFDTPSLPAELQTLREPPADDWLSLTERPGWLRLYGRLSLYSNYEQSLVGRRVQHHRCEAETEIDFEPEHYLQTAGLAAFYDDQHWYYLALSHDEELGRVLRLICNNQWQMSEPLPPIPVPDEPLKLRAKLDGLTLNFSWLGSDGVEQPIEHCMDAGLLSDDAGLRYRFTGAFFVLCAQDHMNLHTPADFHYLSYRKTAAC